MCKWLAGLILATTMIGCSGEPPTPESDKEKTELNVVKEAPKPTPETTKTEATPAPEKLADGHHPALLDPTVATETAPETYKVQFKTTNGNFVIQVNRAWAPNGADRFYNLVKMGFYDGICFFRVISGFMAQYGIHGDPKVTDKWKDAAIPDDPVTQKNTRGRVSFATRGPATRTTQVFINYNDRNVQLDGMGFSPFGEVVEGMNVVDSLYSGYGEGAPKGRGPDQGMMQRVGNAYLNKRFAKLDHILSAKVIP